MTQEERILFDVACKNLIQADKKTLRTIRCIKGMGNFTEFDPQIDQYYAITLKRFEDMCKKIIMTIKTEIIEGNELDLTTEDEAEQARVSESLAFFWKLKGDIYRYQCEFSTGEALKKNIEQVRHCYTKAEDVDLSLGHPIMLDLILGQSIFEKDVLNNAVQAYKLCERTLQDAPDKIDDMEDEMKKQSKAYIETLKQNLQMWKDKAAEKERETKMSMISR